MPIKASICLRASLMLEDTTYVTFLDYKLDIIWGLGRGDLKKINGYLIAIMAYAKFFDSRVQM